MTKFILILLLVFSLIFLLIKLFKNKNLKIGYLLILLLAVLAIYFVYTGKISFLLSFLRSILPNLLKLLGI